ncbi:MAG: acetyl-CoA C-acyltransferase [Phenylobacterium sp.]|uniref:thiolase family protein n=1 Tax=Phenylobacterium sp. TaxID=1871053 RepID=UPI0025D84378|nr:acetyl-CoA C-acyltransferase [Phenylobacterium sp.]MCA3711918.1 acetyl-CoA C-acyltransferase [Phenylobacterium sp.]MCA3729598.1 acetyl-CoA C-acyltransferase [Phenylobacterium sp.]MCA3745419.1 acetyl-CoA C-acyltransferase [Phenylobacterium sp.]MCA3751150.1 acetyl-CoA C-acyltransferase [Phenylobacterium sp.]MCA4916468.1 acetyl-CoA C-acyltransferase [Phenylobacterium sp.]
MEDAVIVSYARTGLTKSVRGGFNTTAPMTLAAHAIRHAVERSGVEPDFVEDCCFGNGTHTQQNIARVGGLLAGLPVTIAGTSVNRHCASGLQAIAIAANHVRADGAGCVVAGGAESISIPGGDTPTELGDPALGAQYPHIGMSMIETAEVVAQRYGVSREAQDEFSLISQRRMASAQQRGLFADEIVSVTATMNQVDKATGEVSRVDVVVNSDECNRPGTTIEDLQRLKPVLGPGTTITAGNASQLSDGAAAVVVMSASEAARRGLQPLGRFVSWAVAGCQPDEMGIGPIYAIPKLLKRFNLRIDDIDLWELNEAFASQCLYCRDHLGIDPEKYNVNGGSIAIGHPYGMTGARLAGHLLLEGRRRKAKWGVVSMCIGGGQGGAGLFEIFS